jgi:hypothetical protein
MRQKYNTLNLKPIKEDRGSIFFEGRFAIQVQGFIFATQFLRWSVRLTVRTPDFHSGNRGSIPLRTTKAADNDIISGFFVLLGVDKSGFPKTNDPSKHFDDPFENQKLQA